MISNHRFKKFEKLSETKMTFEFSSLFNFKKIASSNSFFIYSKHNSSLDIPIGTGDYIVFLKPSEFEYVIMPFTKFIHTQNDSIKELFWLNSTKEKILNRKINFDLPDANRIIELRNYEVR